MTRSLGGKRKNVAYFGCGVMPTLSALPLRVESADEVIGIEGEWGGPEVKLLVGGGKSYLLVLVITNGEYGSVSA